MQKRLDFMRMLLAIFLLAGLVSGASAQTVRAVDGDTIRIGAVSIRLEGIDAPEKNQTCANTQGRDYACGRAARRALARLIEGGVTCDEMGRDRYGRTLAWCMSGAVDVNGAMVEQGWALAFVKYSRRYVAEEARARAGRRGLWAGTFTVPWEWRKSPPLTTNSSCLRRPSGFSKGRERQATCSSAHR